jgi:hypothetical protein
MNMMTENTNLGNMPEVTQATSGEVVSPGSSEIQKKIKIKLYWNKYKGTGKCWLAKVVNGKYEFLSAVDFEDTKGTKERVVDGIPKGGIYEAVKIYEIYEDGEYVAHEQYTKTRDLRHTFEVKNGKIINGKTVYGSGYDKGEEIDFRLKYDD